MELAIQVQILYKAVSILLYANTFRKYMNLSVLPSTIDK